MGGVNTTACPANALIPMAKTQFINMRKIIL